MISENLLPFFAKKQILTNLEDVLVELRKWNLERQGNLNNCLLIGKVEAHRRFDATGDILL